MINIALSRFSENIALVGVPLSPTSFTATYLSDTSLSLAWTDNATNELNYELDRSPNGADTWAALTSPAANATSAIDTGLTVDTTYHYRLRAVNAEGNSSYATASGITTVATALTSVAFKSFVYETNIANTTIDIVVERHHTLDLSFSGAAVATVTASDGFNSSGRYTALSSNVSWSAGDVSSKTVTLTIPAQTLDGHFEVELDLVPVSGCTVRKWEEGAAIARVDDGSVCSFGWHIDPSDPAARDELDAGTAAKPALSSYYFWQDIIFRTHPDPNAPFIVYYHTGNYTDTGLIRWSSVQKGHYPEINGTREHPVKIQNYPGDTVSLANSIGFRLNDKQHVHIRGFDTGTHSNYIDHIAASSTSNFIRIEDLTVSGFRAATGAVNYAGIRMDFTGNTVIRNCSITDYKLDSGALNHNLCPILSYSAYNVLVENCFFDDAQGGIYMKLPPRQVTVGEQGWTIRNNKFGPLLASKIIFTNNTVDPGAFDSVLFYNNLFIGGGASFERIMESNDLAQDVAIVASTLPSQFYNNTMVDCDDFYWTGLNMSHYNNAYRSTANRMLITSLSSQADKDGSIIAYSDYNISNVISGTIIESGPTTSDYATKTAWNAATQSTRLPTASPDTNSTLEAATFTSEGASDYTLTNTSAAAGGKEGMPIGANSNVGLL